MKDYEDLTEEQKNKLSYAWVDVYKGLAVYEEVTGADLADIIADEIWEQVWYQKNNVEV